MQHSQVRKGICAVNLNDVLLWKYNYSAAQKAIVQRPSLIYALVILFVSSPRSAALHCGLSTIIRQPFIGISFFIFYCGEDICGRCVATRNEAKRCNTHHGEQGFVDNPSHLLYSSAKDYFIQRKGLLNIVTLKSLNAQLSNIEATGSVTLRLYGRVG